MTSSVLRVEVVYAGADRQASYPLTLRVGATVREAVAASSVTVDFPEIDLTVNRVAIYGKLVTLESRLRDRDRVEILRPLVADPKEARRRRAAGKSKAG